LEYVHGVRRLWLLILRHDLDALIAIVTTEPGLALARSAAAE
jgi:hypothetical protein